MLIIFAGLDIVRLRAKVSWELLGVLRWSVLFVTVQLCVGACDTTIGNVQVFQHKDPSSCPFLTRTSCLHP
jgi:hypothetical protein